MNVAVNDDLIGEALYVQEIINEFRDDKVFLKKVIDQTIANLDRRIQESTDQLNNRIEWSFGSHNTKRQLVATRGGIDYSV
jgi:hypothetical protein